MNHDSEHSQLLRELSEIERIIEDLTPLRSNWNGTLRMETVEGERGSKSFQCDITLRPGMAAAPLRWRTLIHEMFHACSAGFQMQDFHVCRGWEEGVVEQLSRLFRGPILERLGAEADWEGLDALDRAHPFNRYITALEAIRAAAAAPEPEFYVNLLQTPIRDRYSSLVQGALRMEEARRRRVIAALSASRPVLERRLP